MMSSYSASKRRNINKMLDYDNIEGGKIFERNF